MTLNNRLDTAAAAIVHRMMTRRRPRVFLFVSPFKRGSIETEAIMANEEKDENPMRSQKRVVFARSGS